MFQNPVKQVKSGLPSPVQCQFLSVGITTIDRGRTRSGTPGPQAARGRHAQVWSPWFWQRGGLGPAPSRWVGPAPDTVDTGAPPASLRCPL